MKEIVNLKERIKQNEILINENRKLLIIRLQKQIVVLKKELENVEKTLDRLINE